MLRYSQPVANPFHSTVAFWPLPVFLPTGLPYSLCIVRRDEAVAAYDRAIKSGVVEYHVGSRGLKRFTIQELLDAIKFWTNAANDAALGASSAIQSRRACPCDV